ncbi:MAG: restriction endonuclease subunit S [Flavobacterium sp.]|nr:restriction endonuclease subunit S [Flavobacterium sp.]
MRSKTVRLQIKTLAQGTKVLGIAPRHLSEVLFKIPKKPEQQKIASFLETVDGFIENLQMQKNVLQEYKKGMMQKIFSQKICFKDGDGKKFPEWEEKKLGDMLSIIIDNRGKTPQVELLGIPLIEVNAIGDKAINYSKIKKYVSEKTYINWFRKHLEKKDILFSTVGATAICSIYYAEARATVAQNIVGLRFKHENPEFMYYLLTEKRNKHKFKRIEMVAVQPSVKVSQMIKIKFLIPLLPEQEKIANFLTSIDKTIELKEQQVAQAEQWKKGLMQNLFI